MSEEEETEVKPQLNIQQIHQKLATIENLIQEKNVISSQQNESENKPINAINNAKITKKEMKKHLKMQCKQHLRNLQIRYHSVCRAMNSVSSAINDFSYIVHSLPNDSQYNTRIVQPEKEKNDRKSEISTLANILKKKENRYQGKLARRRDEIKILKEKSYELALKKKALEERIQKANESLESKTETVDLSLVEETINQLDDGITFSDSDGSENSIFKEEEELHHLILGNHKRKEKINADKEKIFNEKQKLIYQNEARQQHLKSTPTIDTNSFNEDEENELHELYERLVNKESEIEKTNKEIDELISNNNQIKEKVESEYENKMNKISKLSDEITEVDQLVIDIHKIKDSIMSLNEELSQIEHSKKKAQRQNGLISVSINVFQKEKEELEKRGIEAERKLKLLEDKEKQLKERRRKFNEENSLCELNQNSISEKKSEIEQIESNIIKYENKIESTNEEIARQSDIVDKLLLEASSNRADSRIQYFQNILNNDNDSEFNSGKQNFSSDVDI